MLDICSVCLCTDIQVRSIEDTLINFHDELCDYGVDEYALYCQKCVHLLRKFYNFKNKCKKANIVLKKWMKQSKRTKIPISKLCKLLPTSIGLSNDNNHAIYSYNAKTGADYSENNIDNLLKTSIDICNENVINLKPGFVILDSTCPAYNKDAIFIKTADFISEENEDAENSGDKRYIDLDVFSDKTKLENDNKKDKRLTVSTVKYINKSVNKNSSDVNCKDNIVIETFDRKTNVEKEVKDKKVEKCKETENIEATVKIELDDDKEHDILDGLAVVAEELKIERNTDDDDDNDDDVLNDDDALNDDDVLNDDDIDDSDKDIDNDALNSEVIKTCGLNGVSFDMEKLLKEALGTDSSDDEVLQKKRSKVISSRKKSNTKKKKVVLKKRKSKDTELDDLEEALFTEDEPKPKKPRWKPLTKQNLEETKSDVKKRLGNGDVKDKEGNVIDVDVILNHLDKMHKYTYNKIKRYCAGEEPLSSEAIDFLGRTAKRYGDQYASIFITKHLTTDEEIMDEFRKRETNQNYVESEHKCTRCFRHFRFAKMLTYHIAEYHDPNKPHKCQYCDVSFNRPQGLRKHLLAHKVVYQCKLCPLVTNYTTVMETHFNIHKGVRYPCTKCEADFKSPPALAAHMNGVHKSDHICPYCARNFHSEFGLHQHKMKKHPNEIGIVGPPSAKCEQCNIHFISDEVYQDHERKRHSDPKNIVAGVDMNKKRKPCSNRRTPRYTCRVCKHVEASMGALIWHFKSKHPNEEFDRKGIALRAPYQYLCHECGKGFKMITSYTDHKNVHTGARPYACTECPKAFHCRTHLRNHLAFHLPPTQQCPQCGKKFHSKSNLSNHLRQHTGNRRYACEVCGKTFLHQGSVNAHVRGVHLHIRRTRKPVKQVVYAPFDKSRDLGF